MQVIVPSDRRQGSAPFGWRMECLLLWAIVKGIWKCWTGLEQLPKKGVEKYSRLPVGWWDCEPSH